MLSQDEKWLLKEKYADVESAEFEADRKRLAVGEPLGYAIGYVPFLGCKIYLDSRPLIPRAETEFWVEKAIAVIKRAAPGAPRVLDLCAGSGAIGVAVARQVPTVQITFAEIYKAHLPTIGKNLNENTILCTNYKVFQSDLFSNVHGEFDFVLCNPPYIDPILDRTESSVKNFEPHEALYGGLGGLELIKKIITASPAHLSAAGELWLEHEPEQSAKIKELAEQNSFVAEVHKDQYGVERYSILTLQKSKNVPK